MKPSKFLSPRFVVAALLVVFGLVTSAFAGPPLICHRLDIGDAKSLPWTGGEWNLSGNENYDTRNLAQDTLAILDSGAPVIVRMETLRRATLYARQDPRAAKELLAKLYRRTMAAENSKPADALAWFDAGYLVEAYRQWFYKDPNPAAGIDGYAMVAKALDLRGGRDTEMEFAAALMTLTGPQQAHHQEHARRAIAGATDDPLLSRNLASRFWSHETQTVSETLVRSTKLEGAQK